uniref:Auxin-responsive protein SAUR21-like n=1 Tax=Nelumbo nucifera TaxID=4432 RepID=A0A822ZFU7_NELNU|nr:TPA_asm: hypothetical protein HUJ06_014821 [Nelumbo nucifera]
MGIRLPGMVLAKALLRRSLLPSAPTANVPKGHFAVYVGDQAQKKRFIVPISYLTNPSFQDLLGQAGGGLGSTIQWVVLQFLAKKINFSTSLLV